MSGQPSPFTSHHPYSSQDFSSSTAPDASTTTAAHPSTFTNQTPPDSGSDNSPSPNSHHQASASAPPQGGSAPASATPGLNLPFNPPYTTDAHGRRHGQASSSAAAAAPYDLNAALSYNGQRQLVPEDLSGIPTPSTPSVSLHSSPYPGAPAVSAHAGPQQQMQTNHPQYPPQPPVYHQPIPSPESYYPPSASGSASRAQLQAQTYSAYYPVGYHPSAVPPDDPNSACNLNALSDGPPNAKPPYPYSTIIRYAIQGSPRGRLTLSELYETMENRFPWFKTAGNGWKNSVRHNLSLNRCFEKEARPITEPGKGSYWIVNPNAPEGNRRVRKRRPRKAKGSANANSQSTEANDSTSQDGAGLDHISADHSFSSNSDHGAPAMDVNPSDLGKEGSHSPVGSPGPAAPNAMGHDQDPNGANMVAGRWAGGMTANGTTTTDTSENHFGTGEAGTWTNSTYPGDPTAVNGFIHHPQYNPPRPLSRSHYQTSTPPSTQPSATLNGARPFSQLGYTNGAENGHLTPVSVGAGGAEQSPSSVPIASSNNKVRPGHPYKTPNTVNGTGSKTNSPPS